MWNDKPNGYLIPIQNSMGISMSMNFYSQIQIKIFTHKLFIDIWIITLPDQPPPVAAAKTMGAIETVRRSTGGGDARNVSFVHWSGCTVRRTLGAADADTSRLIDNERRRYYSNPKAKWLHTDEKMPCARGGGGCNNQSKFVAQICFKELDQSMQLPNTLLCYSQCIILFHYFQVYYVIKNVLKL
jgi:hypothetical protein